MIEKMTQNITTKVGKLLIQIGKQGSEKMCAGFFHEVQVPIELQQELEKNLKFKKNL